MSDVPETATVCHVDEPEDAMRETIATARRGGRSTVTLDPFRAALLDDCRCDLVEFTESYRVERA